MIFHNQSEHGPVQLQLWNPLKHIKRNCCVDEMCVCAAQSHKNADTHILVFGPCPGPLLRRSDGRGESYYFIWSCRVMLMCLTFNSVFEALRLLQYGQKRHWSEHSVKHTNGPIKTHLLVSADFTISLKENSRLFSTHCSQRASAPSNIKHAILLKHTNSFLTVNLV